NLGKNPPLPVGERGIVGKKVTADFGLVRRVNDFGRRAHFAPKQYPLPVFDSEPMTRQPSPTAGEAEKGRPSTSRKRKISWPASRLRPYTFPSFDPTKTRSLTMTGELSTCALVTNIHTPSPVLRSMQCNFLSCEPAI